MITFLDILSTNPDYESLSNNEELKRNLSQQDIPLFNQYTKYLTQDPSIPLTTIFPELATPEYQAFKDAQTHDLIQQYIAEQANNRISMKLNHLSQQVRQERLNPASSRPNIRHTTITNSTGYISTYQLPRNIR